MAFIFINNAHYYLIVDRRGSLGTKKIKKAPPFVLSLAVKDVVSDLCQMAVVLFNGWRCE